MRLLLLAVALTIIGDTEASNGRSVNLALETVLEFDNKDNSADVNFIDKFQSFLDKVKDVIHDGKRKNKKHTRRNLGDRNSRFTDFIRQAINILKTYNDDDLEDVFSVIDDEIRKYHYKGCKFYELIENQSIRRYVADKLDTIKETPAYVIKRGLNDLSYKLKDQNFDDKEVKLLDFVDSLYGKDSEVKIANFLNDLRMYASKTKRANLDLIKIIRNGVRSIIFDHYSDLNVNARRELKIRLETLWHDLSHPENDQHNIWDLRPKLWFPVSENVIRISNIEPYNTENNVHINGTSYANSTKSATTRKHKLFISLYPESITPKRKDKKTTKKPKDKKKKNKKDKKKKGRKGKKSDGVILSVDDAVINVEGKIKPQFSETTKRPKHKHRNRHKTTDSYRSSYDNDKNSENDDDDDKVKKSVTKFRKLMRAHTFGASNEGLSIESFENVDYRSHYRKSNLNDSFIVNNTESSTTEVNVIRRLQEIEKELADVKRKVKTEVTEKVNSQETEINDILDFWEGTTKSINNTTTIKEEVTSVKNTITEKPILRSHDVNFTTTSKIAETVKKNNNVTEKAKTTPIIKNKNLKPIKGKRFRPKPKNLKPKIMPFAEKSNNDSLKLNLEHRDLFTDVSNTSTTLFDVEKLLNGAVINNLDENKKKLVKEKLKQDMEMIFGTTVKEATPYIGNISDPFQDLHLAADLLK